MWGSRRVLRVLFNILLTIVVLALSFWLFRAVRTALAANEEEDSMLMDIYQQQKQQQNAERKEQNERFDILYNGHLETLEKYLPGIVCWGDIITAGNSSDVSYPGVLKEYIDTYICDMYDMTYSLDSDVGLSKVDWEKYKINIPVVNMGGGHENTYTVMGRAGVVPYVTSEEFKIPADTEKVPIKFVSESGKKVTPLMNGSAGVNNVTINGIEGVLTVQAEAGKYVSYSYYYFNRLTPGEETVVPKGTPIVTDGTNKYKDYIHIICIGTYGGYGNPSELVEQVKQFLARQTENTDRYLVIGICSSEGKWRYNSSYFDNMDSAMMQAFGDRYINFRKYLCSDALADAGMEATKQDNNDMAAGVIPSSFRSNSGNSELTAEAYRLLGKLVYNRMDKLGYFDEVRKALKIDYAVQMKLQDDPDYFTNILKSAFLITN